MMRDDLCELVLSDLWRPDPTPGSAESFERIRVDLPDAAALAGVSTVQLRNWLDRDGLFPAWGAGTGTTRLFGIIEILVIAAVRSLVETSLIPATKAIRAVNNSAVYRSLLNNSAIPVSQNKDGSMMAATIPGAVAVTLYPHMLWHEMAPRWRAWFPAETAAFEARLAEVTAGAEMVEA